MKSLVKKILTRSIFLKMRNFFKIKPIMINSQDLLENNSISDAFAWRTDKSITTIFKYTDILNLFLETKDTEIYFEFYNKKFEKIKEFKISDLELSNTLHIDKKFLDGIEDYGIFFVYHKTDKRKLSTVRNSCYVGYSYKKNLPSFVHGNLPVSYSNYNNNVIKFGIIGSSFRRNNKYKIQKNFSTYDKSEILVNNPANKKITFQIDQDKYTLNKQHTILIEIKIKKSILINSNCLILRPVVFSYRGSFMDAHHG